MTMPTFFPRAALLAAFALCLTPLAASAQSAEAAAPVAQGPMIVERVHSGFLVAPDVKVTTVDKRTSELVGGYAGWLTDDQFFIGAGGYWMANQSGGRDMAYGGLIVQWMALSNEHVGFGLKGLFGGGRATLSDTAVQVLALPDLRGGPFGHLDPEQVKLVPTTVQFRYRESFTVAEPELSVRVKLASRIHLTAGVGYRFVGTEFRDSNRLHGAVGSLGLQITGG
jgi:opacity protein-like surface antigen